MIRSGTQGSHFTPVHLWAKITNAYSFWEQWSQGLSRHSCSELVSTVSLFSPEHVKQAHSLLSSELLFAVERAWPTIAQWKHTPKIHIFRNTTPDAMSQLKTLSFTQGTASFIFRNRTKLYNTECPNKCSVAHGDSPQLRWHLSHTWWHSPRVCSQPRVIQWHLAQKIKNCWKHDTQVKLWL